MKDLLINAINSIPESTKKRLIKSFMKTVGISFVIAILLIIAVISPTAFFVSLMFGAIWAWIFSNTKDRY